jgi:S1-C subfamily serine protease
LAVALDRTQTIRTSMAGGIFSQVTADEIRFDGFTVGGSSGSPILNASGEVVAIHRAGLAESAGLAFAVPVRLAIPLLPQTARAEAGIR